MIIELRSSFVEKNEIDHLQSGELELVRPTCVASSCDLIQLSKFLFSLKPSILCHVMT